eukprot:CAMPEP_0174852408 /NCGR_PEP_ID=MMETSP1114-20130205/25351_1 /TAXON_ID=312471 /ORGANISM="Neobodo designis, Strain CCAP 1951/1" /LENGTH=198 /DNA_ID=CAMNT_0016086999 /DNA_START=49 /DNA_END=645 /DNA_ORIENTATION=-
MQLELLLAVLVAIAVLAVIVTVVGLIARLRAEQRAAPAAAEDSDRSDAVNEDEDGDAVHAVLPFETEPLRDDIINNNSTSNTINSSHESVESPAAAGQLKADPEDDLSPYHRHFYDQRSFTDFPADDAASRVNEHDDAPRAQSDLRAGRTGEHDGISQDRHDLLEFPAADFASVNQPDAPRVPSDASFARTHDVRVLI